MKEYKILIFNNKERTNKEMICNEDELKIYINCFVELTDVMICIIPQSLEFGKNEYYKQQYGKYYRQFKKNKINEQMYRKLIKILKKLKIECKDRIEMEKNFEEYKKANNIPPYIVSQK